ESSRWSQKRAVLVGPGSTRSPSRRYSRHGGLLTPSDPVTLALSTPPNPPNHTLIDMLRTLGVRRPANGPVEGTTVERSAGQFKIPALLPQYGQSGLVWISRLTSQFDSFAGLKSRKPPIQEGASFGEAGLA